MDEVLKYENRDRLYQNLIDNHNFIKKSESYEERLFGNFGVTLEGPDFLLSYVSDRGIIEIYIISKEKKHELTDLSFIRDFLYHPGNMNSGDLQYLTNEERVKLLNDFLISNYEKIKTLFNGANYEKTKEQINDLLRESYFRKQQ